MAKQYKQSRQETSGNGSGTQKSSVSGASRAAGGKSQDAEQLLRADHRRVEELFRKLESAGGKSSGEQGPGMGGKMELVGQVCRELVIHSRLEEEIFYPACRQKGVEDDMLDEAQVEHDSLKVLIGNLLGQQPGSPYYDAKVTVLSEYVKHHVAEEEKASSGIFAKARAAGVDMDALGERLGQRKVQLMKETQRGVSEAPEPRSLSLHRESDMARPYERDRDYQGRYRQDDDRDMRRGREFGGRRDDENDARYGERGGFPGQGGSGQGGWTGYQEGRGRNSRQSYWDERDSAGGYAGRGERGEYRGEPGRNYEGRSRGYGGTERFEGDYRGGYSGGGEFSGNRGYTGGYSGGRYEDDWSSRGMGGTREGYGRSGSGSFERERSEYGSFMGTEDRGRMGGRSRTEDDESYTRGGGQARFGNRSGNYSNEDESRGSRHGSRGESSGGQGGWRNRE